MEKGYFKGIVIDDINNKTIRITEAMAEYDNIKNPKNRYYLEISMDNNGQKGTLTVIMFNPSEKNIHERSSLKEKPVDLTANGRKTFIDGTITNVIKIANHCDYSKIVILNLFSQINSKRDEILKNPERFINKRFINDNNDVNTVLNNENDVLIAWGNSSKPAIKKIKENLNSKIQGHCKYFWWNDKSKTPTHPSPYNNEEVKNFLKGKNELCFFS